MIRRAAAFAVALVAVGLLAGAAVGATFTDPAGDVIVVPEGAVVTGLDLTGVEITNTPDGTITFRVTIAGSPPLPPSSVIGIILDLDQNAATGDQGVEAILAYGADELGAPMTLFAVYSALVRELVELDPSALAVTYVGGVLEVTVSRTALLDTTGFTFQALTIVEPANGSAAAADVAPDGGAKYNLAGFTPPRPPKIVATRPRGMPSAPHAGKRFEVRSLVTREDTKLLVSAGRVTCAVTIGGAKLRASGRLGVTGARCAMTIPRNATGKLLRGTMTIRSSGLTTAKRSFSFRVR